MTSLCIASSQKMNNWVSAWNRVETIRWAATAPAFLTVRVSPFSRPLLLHGLWSLSSTLQPGGRASVQAGLWWGTRSALASPESSVSLSVLKDSVTRDRLPGRQLSPPLDFEHSNTASKVSDEKFTNNLWFSAVFLKILFISLVPWEYLALLTGSALSA